MIELINQFGWSVWMGCGIVMQFAGRETVIPTPSLSTTVPLSWMPAQGWRSKAGSARNTFVLVSGYPHLVFSDCFALFKASSAR